MTELGRLEKVNLRDVWEKEDQHFTPWLAREENLAILGETLNLALELEAVEKPVGEFRADILCRNTDDNDTRVLIENQLENTDHKHLGQLMTYAAGLDAATIIWIAAKFTDDHRAAMDWLNEITSDNFRFFGLEVELWKIGNSQAAPKFNIIAKPNDWTRSVARATKQISESDLTPTKTSQFKYWTTFREKLLSENSPVRPQKAYPQHWMNFGIGRSGFHMSALLNSTEHQIGVELNITSDDAKPLFWLLHEDKDEIESKLGFELDWKELLNRKQSKLLFVKPNCNPMNELHWADYQNWMQSHLEKLKAVMGPYIKALDAAQGGGTYD
ncbi:MAG: DUF4268 domain-containing protein [Terasakiella sp.]|uniref:DUF4268 domain-containing protein n=1 Tax=unclassified Terasakiella TaxID=2614952 RepID=UPI003B005F74